MPKYVCPHCGKDITPIVHEHSDQDKILAVLAWSEAGEDDAAKKFDDSFIRSLDGALEQYNRLTPRQAGALNNIIAKFDIDVDKWV